MLNIFCNTSKLYVFVSWNITTHVIGTRISLFKKFCSQSGFLKGFTEIYHILLAKFECKRSTRSCVKIYEDVGKKYDT